MPTDKARLNISLRKEVRDALENISKRDSVPQATTAARLLEIALELEEDQTWDALASKRDTSNARYISHDNTWK